MAKSQLQYKRQTVESLSIKGILNEDATSIIYNDEDNNEVTLPISSLMQNFCAMPIELSLKQKAEEELELQDNDEIDMDEALAYTE